MKWCIVFMFIYFEIQLLFMNESFAVSFKFMYLLIFGNLYSSCSFSNRMSKGMPISVRQWATPWSNSGECAAICTKSNSALSPYRQVSVWVSLHNIAPHAKYSSDWSLSPLFHRFTVFSLLTPVWYTVHSVYVMFIPLFAEPVCALYWSVFIFIPHWCT